MYVCKSTGGGGGNKFLLHHARWDFPGNPKGPPQHLQHLSTASAIKQKADNSSNENNFPISNRQTEAIFFFHFDFWFITDDSQQLISS